MIALTGFGIALLVGMTGVGGGILTVPLLMILFGVDPAHAVGAALLFSTSIKLLLVPLAAARGQVNWRVLGWMLLGGVPGALLGSVALKGLMASGAKSVVQFLLGVIIASAATIHLAAAKRKKADGDAPRKDRPRTLGALMFPVGLEVGFSSAGAGALGSVALLSLTSLTAAEVVGTDLAFGLGLSAIAGGMHFHFGDVDTALLTQLLTGGLAGAAVGAFLASQVSQRFLKLVLSSSLLLIGLHLCWGAIR
jgi:uncharacterized membrane protein YfcA